MNRSRAVVALTIFAIAVAASLYALPALARPYWTGEGEEFILPCQEEGYDPETCRYGSYGNRTCPSCQSECEGGLGRQLRCVAGGGEPNGSRNGFGCNVVRGQGSGPRMGGFGCRKGGS